MSQYFFPNALSNLLTEHELDLDVSLAMQSTGTKKDSDNEALVKQWDVREYTTLLINPFPHDKILDQTKLKAFADDKLNVPKMIISVFDRVENIVGKGEIACSSNFSFSYNVFKRHIS